LSVDSKTNSTQSPEALQEQAETDELLAYVNQQIELLAFDEPDPALLRQMVQRLRDSRRSARVRLVEAFGEIGEVATPALLNGLQVEADPTVRVACCHALTNIGDAAAVPGLIQALLSDRDISVKSAAAGALAKTGEAAFAPLKSVLADEGASEICKGHAAWAIALMSSEVEPQLYASLNDPTATVRTAMVGAIAQLAQSQTTEAQRIEPEAQSGLSSKPLTLLIEALQDPSDEVRIEAVANLARLRYLAAYEPLIRCLNDEVSAVRKSVVLALGRFDNADAVKEIAPLQQDNDPEVQRIAKIISKQLTSQ